MKQVMIFDKDNCSACNACVIACMDQNDIDVQAGERAYRKTYDNELPGEGGYRHLYLSAACMHCDDAPCISACPVGCLKKDEETGFTVYDNQHCIGCKSCAMACPFGAPRYRQADGKMVKCDGCHVRVKHGMKPACVRACTFDALDCMTRAEYEESGSGKAVNTLVKALEQRL